MNKNKFFNTQMIVEAGIMLALSVILAQFKLYKMPQGGSISLKLLPLMIFAIRWGAPAGMIVGAIFGVITLIIKPEIVHPIQVILDYPLPSSLMGIAGLTYLNNKSEFKGYIPFIILSYLLRLVVHFLSGIIYFAQYTPKGMSPVYYSFIYNITYLGPELLIFLVFMGLFWKYLTAILKKQM
ncbi:energy-coupled thiamine transporter ThiT [Helcococcus ovis]|uniref:energy-coupled thiamine transporter ThiT n=1 Tax=Helcococcus ovis TaxID=72026 RepID=UPI0038BB6B39